MFNRHALEMLLLKAAGRAPLPISSTPAWEPGAVPTAVPSTQCGCFSCSLPSQRIPPSNRERDGGFGSIRTHPFRVLDRISNKSAMTPEKLKTAGTASCRTDHCSRRAGANDPDHNRPWPQPQSVKALHICVCVWCMCVYICVCVRVHVYACV